MSDYEGPIERAERLKQEIRELADEAKRVDQEAQADGWTEPRKQKVKDLLEQVKSRKAELDGSRFSVQLAELSRDLGYGGMSAHGDLAPSKDFGWTKQIAAKALDPARKELIAPGSVFTSVPMLALIAEPQRAQFVADLLPTRTMAEPVFTYLRQTVRTLAAAPVELGAEKPTSTIGVEAVGGGVATIAHLSEPIHKQYLADSTMLSQFVQSELVYGLRTAVDLAILNGYTQENGDQAPGLLNVAGHLEQPLTEDAITALRRAILQIEEQDLRPTSVVLNPADWADLELEQDENGRYQMGPPGQLPINSAQRTIWGLGVAVTTGVPGGTGLVMSNEVAQILSRQTATVSWTEFAGDLFETNRVKFRAELRCALAIQRPSALCVVDLAGDTTGGATETG